MVELRPPPLAPQSPSINDIADQIQLIKMMRFEEIKKLFRLTVTASEMQIAHESSFDSRYSVGRVTNGLRHLGSKSELRNTDEL